jgi:hypothetical protein
MIMYVTLELLLCNVDWYGFVVVEMNVLGSVTGCNYLRVQYGLLTRNMLP